MIERLNHIGIAVEDLEEAIRLYRDVIGLSFEGIEEVPSERVRVAMFKVGETRIELLQGTGDDSPITKSIKKRGMGVHHLAFTVDDAAESLERLSSAGLRVLDESPRPGAHGTKVVFVHPKSTMGVLTELVEEPE
jgi:methylmalonyl-CoA/ethylmalonyl-CoA epimerase